jgi:hypothetical protein
VQHRPFLGDPVAAPRRTPRGLFDAAKIVRRRIGAPVDAAGLAPAVSSVCSQAASQEKQQKQDVIGAARNFYRPRLLPV